MRSLWEDVRFGLRLLAARPGHSAALVAVLALGIGATTAIFSVVNAVVLNSLPFPSPEQILEIQGAGEEPYESLSPIEFAAWRERSRVFASVAASRSDHFVILSGTAQPEHLFGERVSKECLALLGTPPLIGRWFVEDEFRAGAAPAVVIGEALWQRQFGRDPGIVGKSITLDGAAHTVVGVMPAAFRFRGFRREVWRPLQISQEDEGSPDARFLSVIGRLKPGATIEEAKSEGRYLAGDLARQYPATHKNWHAAFGPLRDTRLDEARTPVLVLFGAVAFVLLIACVNVASLLLARAAERKKEMSIRAALGAGRARVIRQLLTESLLLSAIGGAAGLAAAHQAVRALAALPAARAEQVSLDGRVLGFSLLVTVVCGLVFGLVPALETSRADLGEGLKQGARTGTGGRRTRRARNLLIVFETSLSLVLLAGAGLMMRSFFRLVGTDPGFRREGVLSARLPLPVFRIGDRAHEATYAGELLDRIERLPGVKAAALVSVPPLGSLHFSMSFSCQCPPATKEKYKIVSYRAVSPDYFRILGIPIRNGRAFAKADVRTKAVIVNEALARALWPNENPIGKLVTLESDGTGDWMPVVGVAADVRDKFLQSAPSPEFFLPYGVSLGLPHVSVVVRTAGDPARFAPVLRKAVRESFAEQPVEDLQTLEQISAGSVSQPRLYTMLLGIFAAAALLLASMGMFAVTAYGVTERRREIGIRMALGAAGPDVVGLMVRESVRPLAAGIALGIPAALAACRVLESQLYGVRPDDLGTFAAVPFVLAAVVLMACWVPARRAVRVDPMSALRAE